MSDKIAHWAKGTPATKEMVFPVGTMGNELAVRLCEILKVEYATKVVLTVDVDKPLMVTVTQIVTADQEGEILQAINR